MEQPDNAPDMDTVRQMLKRNCKEEWLNRWSAGSTGRVMYKEMTKPNTNDNINKLTRKEQCTIFQLRTSHARTNYHLNRTNPLHLPLCRNCTAPHETVRHVLLECPNLQQLRSKLLPQQPSINNTLYSTLTQLQKTCRYFNLTFSQE